MGGLAANTGMQGTATAILDANTLAFKEDSQWAQGLII